MMSGSSGGKCVCLSFVYMRFILEPSKEIRARISNAESLDSEVKIGKELFIGNNLR